MSRLLCPAAIGGVHNQAPVGTDAGVRRQARTPGEPGHRTRPERRRVVSGERARQTGKPTAATPASRATLTAIQSSRRRVSVAGATAPSCVPEKASSISIRASAASCRRRRASFRRQRRSSRRMDAGVASGSASSRARGRARRRSCPRRSPANAGAPGQHLVEHAAERPDVGALVDGLPARLLGAHVRRRAENDARLRSSPAIVIVGECVSALRRRRRGSIAFARPKSSTFTTPSARDLDVGRLQIAMDDAAARARLRAPRRSAARSAAPRRRGIGPRAIRSASVVALDQLQHERRGCRRRLLEPVDRARCADDSAPPAARASRSKRAQPLGIARERVAAGP